MLARTLFLLVIVATSSFAFAKAPKEIPVESELSVLLKIEESSSSFAIITQWPSRSTEIITYQDGEDLTLHKRPGRSIVENFSFVSLDAALIAFCQEWYATVLSGKIERRTVSMLVYDKDDILINQYDLFGCWPAKWSAGALEEWTICVENITPVPLPE